MATEYDDISSQLLGVNPEIAKLLKYMADESKGHASIFDNIILLLRGGPVDVSNDPSKVSARFEGIHHSLEK